MIDKIEKFYMEAFILYLKENIDFSYYDNKFSNSNLYFGKSLTIINNLKSDFYNLKNSLYLDNLEDEYKNIINSKDTIDEEIIDVVSKTYKKVIEKPNVKYVMYNPPMPEHNVENGSLVLEFSYGKNTKRMDDNEYVEFVKKQRQFINDVNEELKKEIYNKLGIKCFIFVKKVV